MKSNQTVLSMVLTMLTASAYAAPGEPGDITAQPVTDATTGAGGGSSAGDSSFCGAGIIPMLPLDLLALGWVKFPTSGARRYGRY